MPLSLDVLLAILVATLIANTLVMVLLVRRARNRTRSLSAAETPAPTRAVAAAPSGPAVSVGSGSVTAASLGSGSLGSRSPVGPDARPAGPDARPSAPDGRPSAPRAAAAAPEAPGFLDAGAFHELLAREDGRLQRYHRPATVAVFELEGLPRLTEHLGPEAGERVVAAMADTVRRLAREADHVATLGVGRFAVLLPETDEVASINYIERVRRASELWLESSAIAVRLAIGWAGTTGDPSLLDTHQVALDRMYAEARRHARSTAALAGVDVDILGGPGMESAVAS